MRRTSRGLEIANCPADADPDQSSVRTLLAKTEDGLLLLYATPGTELAGSILRWRAKEGWLVTRAVAGGSTVGQWFASPREANVRFEQWRNGAKLVPLSRMCEECGDEFAPSSRFVLIGPCCGGGRYQVAAWHGEGGTVFSVVDTSQPDDEQPCVVESWALPAEPNARYLADDFCERHNAKEGA